MIPVYECLDGACIVGWVWRPEMVAAFLSWWLPLNLICFYAVSFSMAYQRGELYREHIRLPHHFLMALFFIPYVAAALLLTLFLSATDDYRHNRRVIRKHKKEPVK